MSFEEKNKPVAEKTKGRKPFHADMMIKICGMKDEDNIRMIEYLTPMLMGFIFYPKSPRYAGALAPEAVKGLPKFVRPVGVFVDASEEKIVETCCRYGIGIVQLHGSESPEVCRRLKERGFVVFKAVGMDSSIDWESLRGYEGNVDLFLFDTRCPSHGGSGKKFDWDLLEGYPLSVPYLLSGGISPEDTDAIIAAMRPGMAGIDINSGFETEPGVKDFQKLVDFILKLRSYNEREPSSIPFWEKGK